MPINVDVLTPEKHLIDLETHIDSDFDFADRFVLKSVTDDIIIAEFIDLTEDGNNITRGGIHIPLNTLTKAWRKAKVLIVGPKAEQVKVGDVVVFPNDKGLPVTNLPIVFDGKRLKLKHGIFLNEDRIFGICEAIEDEGE
jgi:co-chaperonin GroES (HSP10)